MKKQFKMISVLAILLIVLAAAALPAPVKAALSIMSVSPNLVVNDVPNTITIVGTDFASGVQVSVGGTDVTTTFVGTTTITAIIPPGFAPGIHTVKAVNPDTTSATLTAGLTVVAPTATPVATITPQPTSTTAPFARPQVVVDTYSISVNAVSYGQDFTLNLSLDNAGGSTAYGIQVLFSSSELLMLGNGGVVSGGNLGAVGKSKISQKMTAAAALTGARVSLDMTVNYYDEKGSAFTDKFTLFFPVASSASGGPYVAATATPTPTPTGLQRSQLVIAGYETDLTPLQPGYQFVLKVSVQNVGSIAAKGVTMIVGGGSTSGSTGGTPQPGGVSGGSGDFTTFAPVGSSNIQSLGDFAPGATLTASQKMIVNVSANPGAYPMKISFSYTDSKGNQSNDDQIITLMVYSLPNVDVGFYQPVTEWMAGQPNVLPLQVTNLARRLVVLGKMRVETTAGMVENGEALVGSLDPGGYFTLDSTLTPNEAGPLALTINIEYLDDFNQPRTITKTLSLQVSDAPLMPTPDPNNPNGGTDIPAAPESFWQKVWRFILGIFGLDSSAPVTTPMGVPTMEATPYLNPGGKGG